MGLAARHLGDEASGCAGKGARSAEDHPRRETGQVVQPIDAVNMQALQCQIPQGLGSLTGLLAVLKEQDHVFLRLMFFQPERHPRQNSAVSVVAAAVIRAVFSGDGVQICPEGHRLFLWLSAIKADHPVVITSYFHCSMGTQKLLQQCRRVRLLSGEPGRLMELCAQSLDLFQHISHLFSVTI